MLDWQQRVVDERNELQEKVNRLTNFVYNNSTFSLLPEIERNALKYQRQLMCGYVSVLNGRIDRFTDG